jgi:phage tail sheath protein FI
VLAATALSAGSDDRTNATDTEWTTALNRSIIDLGTGAVLAPGRTGDTIFDIIEAHCEATNRIAILCGAVDDTIGELQTAAAARNSEYSGLFAPWLAIDDGFGGTRIVSPEGFVAAKRAQAHATVGAWRAPAGSIGKSNYVLSVQDGFAYTADEINTLADSKVNVIRANTSGVRLYGWKSTTEDIENWEYLNNRDLVNYFVDEGTKRLEEYVFSPIDAKGHTLSQVKASLIGLADPIRLGGGLFERIDAATGEQIDPGYRVTCDQTNNSASSLAQNEINAELAVRISPVGGLIRLKITKVGTLGGL